MAYAPVDGEFSHGVVGTAERLARAPPVLDHRHTTSVWRAAAAKTYVIAVHTLKRALQYDDRHMDGRGRKS